jgi:hypothetical protein
MRLSFIRKIHCPYCLASFKGGLIAVKKEKTKDEIVYGTVFCKCDEFPIISGILYLKRERSRKIVSLIQSQKYEQALAVALSGRLSKISLRLGILRLRGLQFVCRQLFGVHTEGSAMARLFYRQLFYYFYGSWAEAEYALNRPLERDSLLFFAPLAFLPKLEKNQITQKKVLWLNIGSGLRTFYSFFKNQNFLFLSVEQNFIDLYISYQFFSSPQTIALCHDITLGSPVPSNLVTVVTLIDSLPFIDNPRQVLSYFVGDNIKGPLIFATSIPEKFYLPESAHVLPLLKETVKTFLGKNAYFFDNEKMAHDLGKNNVSVESLRAKKDSFRYGFVYGSSKKELLTHVSLAVVPEKLMQKNHFLWEQSDVLWQNRVFK